ncbi:MAG: acyltransferase [Acidobacteriota bacterium]|nr:acyltransferase [Acidobacteriota bacterium]
MEQNLIEERAIPGPNGTLAVAKDLPNLDVLRAFAVLAVAGSHLFRFSIKFPYPASVHNFSVGGVLFFFVHTSLVLLLSMQRTRSNNLTLNFYIRRAFRIYPLCWACIILVLATGLTDVPGKLIVQMGWRGILANLALVQNIIRYPNIEMPLWSLPWEVQMYLLLPAIFLILRKYDRARVPLAMWFGATVLAIAFTVLNVPRVFQAAVFPPMFIGGMVAFRLLGQVRVRFPSFAWPLAILGLMLARCVFMRGVLITTPRNVAVNAATCLLLGLAIPLFAEVRSPWLRYLAHQLAKYSYGIYLLHIPSLALVFTYMPWLPLPLKVVAFIAITGAASVMAYHLIENPLIQVGRSIAKKVG